MSSTKVLIVVFDALRPEFVTPELMPNLYGFAAQNSWFEKSRSTFPTETRVNQSAVITGCLPRSHGVVGNKFVADDLQPGMMVNSGDDNMLATALATGSVLKRRTMGQILTAARKRFVSLSAGTPGGGRLINWSAEADQSFRLAMRNPDACVPKDLFQRLVNRVGPLPTYELPAIDWIGWAVSAYLDFIVPELSPDVMLLWLCEPDESFHWKGIGSPLAMQTIRNSDRQFGRILSSQANELVNGDLQIIAISDHGQLTVTGSRLDLVAQLEDIGIRASQTEMSGVDCVVSAANAGGIWVRDRDAELIERILRFLLQQDWCGPVFTRSGALGTLQQKHIGTDHPRSPDISLVMKASDAENRYGARGLSPHASPYPDGGGCHGGLSQWELQNVLVCGGSRFKTSQRLPTPAGNPDILPTVLALLREQIPTEIDGRVLSEAFLEGPDPDTLQWDQHIHSSSNAIGPITYLDATSLGEHTYLNKAWVEG